MFMKAIGVRELKARLSAYLREVAGGEVVLVTDRGRVVAELRAPGSVVTAESPLDRSLRALAEAGGLVVGGPHDATAYRRSPVQVPEGTAQALLAEERTEG
jgi:antitoxin (DNA-binding transcriptional repressor) of toxin-antitoxin stability system